MELIEDDEEQDCEQKNEQALIRHRQSPHVRIKGRTVRGQLGTGKHKNSQKDDTCTRFLYHEGDTCSEEYCNT